MVGCHLVRCQRTRLPVGVSTWDSSKPGTEQGRSRVFATLAGHVIRLTSDVITVVVVPCNVIAVVIVVVYDVVDRCR